MLVTTFNVRVTKWCGRTARRLWDVHHSGFLGPVYTMSEKALRQFGVAKKGLGRCVLTPQAYLGLNTSMRGEY